MLRVPSYLLRVELEDRPGSLGSLAVALGSVGADILSLDVVERTSGYAVDDLVVELTQLTGYRTYLMADWVRGINRLRSLLGSISPLWRRRSTTPPARH